MIRYVYFLFNSAKWALKYHNFKYVNDSVKTWNIDIFVIKHNTSRQLTTILVNVIQNRLKTGGEKKEVSSGRRVEKRSV
jgi:hypothetical protein